VAAAATTDQIGRILSHDAFVDFYLPIDLAPEIVEERVPAALDALAERLPDNPDVQLIVAFIETPPAAEDIEAQVAAVNAFLAVGHLANLEAAKPRPDRELIRLILTMYSAFPPCRSCTTCPPKTTSCSCRRWRAGARRWR
jgi:hypothetical protein